MFNLIKQEKIVMKIINELNSQRLIHKSIKRNRKKNKFTLFQDKLLIEEFRGLIQFIMKMTTIINKKKIIFKLNRKVKVKVKIKYTLMMKMTF